MNVIERGYEIFITGLVQGVGFRPFICRLASSYGLTGEVVNRSDGVRVILMCDAETAGSFAAAIRSGAPAASVIRSVEIRETDVRSYDEFSIFPSRSIDETITEVSPDIAVCDDCLSDLVSDPGRTDYPFINCTNCGPRFTIIKSLPYDRKTPQWLPFVCVSVVLRSTETWLTGDSMPNRLHATVAGRYSHYGPAAGS